VIVQETARHQEKGRFARMKLCRLAGTGWLLLVAILPVACSGLPPFDQQKRLVQQGDFQIRQLTPRAFVEIWGEPTYIHQQFTHFFGMKDGRLIPQARMALGESPQGWETGLAAGDALFLAYADRGHYLVFLDNVLVYQEAMTSEKVHAIGKSWKHESQFKTRLESPPASQ